MRDKLKDRAARCVTHHAACDCREYAYRERIERLEAALRDMLSGWRYIRAVHGDLYGVGWDRAQRKAEEALADDGAGGGDEQCPKCEGPMREYTVVCCPECDVTVHPSRPCDDTPPQRRKALRAVNMIPTYARQRMIPSVDHACDDIRRALEQQNSAENKHSYAVPEAVRRLPERMSLYKAKVRSRGKEHTAYEVAGIVEFWMEELERALAQHSEPGREDLSFAQLRAANVERCESAFHALDHWNPMEWGAACAGEVGEGINAAKKLRRVDDSEQYKKTLPTTDVTLQDVADEIADAVIYADLWAASIGVDLGAAVADKFNRTSEKVQSDVRLATPAPDADERE